MTAPYAGFSSTPGMALPSGTVAGAGSGPNGSISRIRSSTLPSKHKARQGLMPTAAASGIERGNTRDPEMDATPQGRRYI
jgi:hypothetical protein